MNRGRFITFEGGEGAGKSTQARLLVDALRVRGVEAVMTREPGGTPGAEAIRQLLLDPPGAGWLPEAEALLFAAARADHVARVIRPALNAGQWVVCDRFLDSSRAYQGSGGGVGDQAILDLHRIGTGDLLPDLTLLIEIEPSAAAARLAARDGASNDAIGGRGPAYHAQVAAAFAGLAATEPKRFTAVPGGGTVEQTHEAVMALLAPLLVDAG